MQGVTATWNTFTSDKCCALPKLYFAAALILACAVFTVDFNSSMTFSGSGALKIAVPATITLLPAEKTA